MARLSALRSVQANCRRALPRLVHRYFRKGGQLLRSNPDFAELHAFRILTKRLRYIIECYAEIYPIPLRGALSQLRVIQNLLGNLQDQTTVISYFERRLMHVRTPLRQAEYLRVLHRARVRQNIFHIAFFRCWSTLERSHFEHQLIAGIKRVTKRNTVK